MYCTASQAALKDVLLSKHRPCVACWFLAVNFSFRALGSICLIAAAVLLAVAVAAGPAEQPVTRTH